MAIIKKWKYLDRNDRMRMREALWTNYLNMATTNVPRIQREKIAQLIALMGKREFPDEHATYMNHIVDLLKSNFQLGITLLRSTSEEVMSTRDDIASDRKKYFHSNVSLCMPEIFELLTQFLTIQAYDINIVHRKLIEDNPNNRINTSAIELLQTVQHLLSWIQLDELVHEQFIVHLFELSRYKENGSDTSVAAINTITELFYRQRALPFPHVIGNGIKNILKQSNLDTADEQYQDKLTELLRLFVAQEWSKWIDDELIFPEIISALYSYTFASYGALAFTERLSIWHPIISGMHANGFGRYASTMHLLVACILHKIQFRMDPELKILDNESLDDDVSDGQIAYDNVKFSIFSKFFFFFRMTDDD